MRFPQIMCTAEINVEEFPAEQNIAKLKSEFWPNSRSCIPHIFGKDSLEFHNIYSLFLFKIEDSLISQNLLMS